MLRAQWLYLKLYVGAFMEKLDGLILDVIPGLDRELCPRHRFFIRYMDERGVHLRVRMLLPEGQFEQASLIACELAGKSINSLSTLHSPLLKPIVRVPDSVVALPASGYCGVVVDTYEPELEQFGGTVGTEFAEAAFNASTDITLQILLLERAGHVDRRRLALELMRAAETCGLQKPRDEFWNEYSTYWLGGAGDVAEFYRRQFLDKLGKGTMTAWTLPLSDKGRAVVHAWSDALTSASAKYDAAGITTSRDFRGPLWQLVHLMNNRLGISVLDEAFLATVLGIAA